MYFNSLEKLNEKICIKILLWKYSYGNKFHSDTGTPLPPSTPQINCEVSHEYTPTTTHTSDEL